MKNIPFCDNEKRYYELLKNRQNHRYWVDSWKKYCNLNIVDPPPPPKIKEEAPPVNNFLRALMNMSKKAQAANITTPIQPI